MTTPSSQISQDEINAILWKACDTFRGTVDPSEYKNYILVMLFVKYISDVWRDKEEQYMQQFDGDQERVERRMKRERFVLPKNMGYYSLYEQRNAQNLGEIIDIALAAIEETNIEKLQGVFRNITFNSEAALGQTKQRNERLKNLLNDFHDPRLDMRPSRIGGLDVIGNAYEYLIGKFAAGAGKKGGEFYTPAEVSRLLAMLLDPQPGERIYDPTCGSGSLLIKCAEEVDGDDYALYGQESNGSTWALAMMNMFLHDVSQPHIAWEDTIRAPQHLEGDNLMRFNVVTANPPFSLDKWGAGTAANDPHGRFWRGVPPKSKGDYAFLTHMIESTYVEESQNGRVGVVVPHGVLFRGSSEGKIRQKLIEENLLDAVIGLPANLFFGTGIPAAILIFRRARADRGVLFIDASRDFEQSSAQNKLRPEDLARIMAAYKARESVDKFAYVASFEELKENDFNLNIPRYVDTFEPEPPVDMGVVNTEIRNLKDELGVVEEKMASYLQELGLDE
ncbi:MAG: type I restriction-modification system subunit M [Anaerolineae bacterium]|mgnify:CR=1 FL=1|jgi:type I restriction enzyme M protein|nr:type I restriction-modification system subunit M [Anaerolineae bacterium]MBT6063108.1 type I restriction-modification system subunit M [Anaerolineae bacterium]MBT6321769.1 type I restriction-modification system subunit M [Anaerolineae bacterium]MBT6812949.1 type I restriction-modification system subunit M [Anaerolineae bacterium]MBT7601203.1 type I restriction-modification system subunit M [Anaerolineae bacterium]